MIDSLKKDLEEGRVSKSVLARLLSELVYLNNPRFLEDQAVFIKHNASRIIDDRSFFEGFVLGIASAVASLTVPEYSYVGDQAAFLYSTLQQGMLAHYEEELIKIQERNDAQSNPKGNSPTKDEPGKKLH